MADDSGGDERGDDTGNPDAYGKPIPKTWAQAVKAAGGDVASARVKYPTLDPAYQKLVSTEGAAKANVDYAQTYIDPSNEPANEGSVLGAFSPRSPDEGFHEYEQGLQDLRNRGGAVGGAIADVGQVLDTGGKDLANLGSDLFGGAPVVPDASSDPTKTTKKPKPTTKPTTAPPSAAEGLLDALANQYQSAMGSVNPYIGGGNEAGFAAEAQGIGQGIAGGGVQAQNAGSAGILNADAAAYEKANNAGSAGIATALRDTGQADQQYLAVSPYVGVLNALTSEAQYKTETGTPPTSVTGAKMPSWLESAYQATIGSGTPGTSTVGNLSAFGNQGSQGSQGATTPSTDTSDVAGGGNG